MTNSNKQHLLENQGYYYLVKTTWNTAPGKTFINEYGNEEAANKAANHWNSMPDCSATVEKRYE